MLMRPHRFLSPQRVTGALAGFGFAILFTAITDALAAQSIVVLAIVAGVALMAWLISLVIRRPSDIAVFIQAPQTIRNEYDALYIARQAFVGFVPLYRPKRDSAADRLSDAERQAAIATFDFNTLQLEDSNLAPTIAAICAHQSQLKHCWLLTTMGQRAPGSLPYAELLAEYLRQRKGITCEFHYGPHYAVPLEDDALVLSKTYDLVRRVFNEANELKIPLRDLVADITTGFRSMTLGMVLACLDKERDIEFIGTHYNSDGVPVGDLTPTIFSFEPSFNTQDRGG